MENGTCTFLFLFAFVVDIIMFFFFCQRVCNYFGTQEYAWVLDWEGRDCYRAAPTTTWMLNNGTVGGWLQAFGNLSRLVIVGAGHMSPFDQPYSLHQMVYQWIGGMFGKPGQKQC